MNMLSIPTVVIRKAGSLVLILLIALTITAKDTDSNCIKELNKCRNTCYEQGIKPDGECILKCYKEADRCK